MKSKRVFVFLIVMLGALVLAGCAGQATLSLQDQQTQAAIFAQATLTKQALLDQAAASTDTAQVPPSATALLPTATAQAPTQAPTASVVVGSPTAEPLPAPCKTVRLSFDLGGTNMSQQGTVADNATCRYIFSADVDQLVSVSVQSANQVLLSISNAKGKVLLPFSSEQSSFRGYLPASGDWYLDIKAAPVAAAYSIYLEIPERLNFPTGSYEMNAAGTVPAAGVHNYLIWANGGQKLTVNVTPAQSAILEVYEVNGNVLLSTQSNTSSFSVTLPELGDYMVNVVNQTESPIDFNISVEIR